MLNARVRALFPRGLAPDGDDDNGGNVVFGGGGKVVFAFVGLEDSTVGDSSTSSTRVDGLRESRRGRRRDVISATLS